MNSVAISIVSVFAGVLLVLLIGGMAALIVLHLRAAKAHRELLTRMDVFAQETTENFATFSTSLAGVLTQQRADVGTMIDGARSSFTGIRQDIKTAQEAQGKSLAKSLKEFEAAFRESIGKINGEALFKASVENMRAVREMTALCITLKSVLADHEAPAALTELGPEEYGPSDTIYSRVAETARLDEAAQDEAAAESAPQFSSGMAE